MGNYPEKVQTILNNWYDVMYDIIISENEIEAIRENIIEAVDNNVAPVLIKSFVDTGEAIVDNEATIDMLLRKTYVECIFIKLRNLDLLDVVDIDSKKQYIPTTKGFKVAKLLSSLKINK